jgi:hypothetical protein
MSLLIALAMVALTGAPENQSASAQSVNTTIDPSVVAYTALVKHMDLDIPINRTKVIAFVDLLMSTLEGFAIGRGVSDDAFLSRSHNARLELRRFAAQPIDTPGRERLGHQIFTAVAQLFQNIHGRFGPDPASKSAVEAIDRSARSLDLETPLRWQPDNVQQFLRLGGEALTKMAALPVPIRK